MKELLHILQQVPQFPALVQALETGQSPAAVSGLSRIHRAHFAAGLGTALDRPVVMVCADEDEAQALGRDITAFIGWSVTLIGSREFNFYNGAVASHQGEHSRLAAFYAMAQGECKVITATVEGLLQRTLSPEELLEHVVTICSGGSYDPTQLADALSALGYTRCDQVEGVGQFALRGGILDVFSPAQDHPVRVEFWDTDVDSMGLFDPATQRRVGHLDKAVFLPVREVLPQRQEDGSWQQVPDAQLPQRYPVAHTAVHHLPPDAVVCLSESARVAERGKNWLWQLDEDLKTLVESGVQLGKHATFALTFPQLMEELSQFPLCFLDSFSTSTLPLPPKALFNAQGRQLSTFGANLDSAAADLTQLQQAKTGTVVLVGSEQQALNLQALLREKKIRSAVDFQLHELPAPGGITIAVGGLSAGFDYIGCPWAVTINSKMMKYGSVFTASG